MSLTSITTAAGLPLLGPHLPTLLISTISFFTIQRLSHRLAPLWLGSKWDEFDKRTKKGWASHAVSMAHALIIIPLAAKSLQSKILARDPVFGYDPLVGHVLALSSGYFIWDTVDSLLNSTIGFVVHGACCLAVYLFSFRPFLAGFGPSFLLWELSTPFLNLHWFMDKTGLSTKYPTFYLLNALVFMLVFFLARILFGGYQSIAFFKAMYENRHQIPIHLHVIYGVGNLALNGLNMLWFSKMFAKMIARLHGNDDVKSESKSRQVQDRDGKGRLGVGKEEEKDPLLRRSDSGKESDEGEGGLTLPASPPSPVTVSKEPL